MSAPREGVDALGAGEDMRKMRLITETALLTDLGQAHGGVLNLSLIHK